MTKKFTWPQYPRTDAEFESLMHAVDKSLDAKGLKPFQRPLHVSRAFWEAFGWGGNILPPRTLAMNSGFQGDVLMAKAHHWYEQTYGDQLKGDFAYGFVPVRLANAIWRVRLGLAWGQVRLFADKNLKNHGVPLGAGGTEASLNVLAAIEQLPQGLANRLSESAVQEFLEFYVFAFRSLQWLDSLPRTELLEMARNDYAASTADVVECRYGQARWAAQQSVEKTIKGLLAIGGTKFPTGGAKGHDLKLLADLLQSSHQIAIEPSLLDAVGCPASVRYGAELSTASQSLNSNHSALAIFHQLQANQNTKHLLAKQVIE